MRTPLHHPERIRARDRKLQQRDEVRAHRNGLDRYRCPCNLCGGRRRPYKATTVARHLRHRGRHGALRGWREVIIVPHHNCDFVLKHVLEHDFCHALHSCALTCISCCGVIQGDDYDSSDAEWDAHIGGHARAFLGLNEPIAEIPLDDDVGMGTMVRNAFARADGIHQRASTTGDGDTDETAQVRLSRSDTDMHSNSSPMSVDQLSDPAVSPHQPACGHGEGDGDGAPSSTEGFSGMPENVPHEDGSGNDYSEEGRDASSDSPSEVEDLEDLLGQIPHDRLGSNPATDIAATLPLYEGASLSMLCATLLIVNCCKTHGVSNMFLNELLMLLSMSILPVGNCLPKTEYEATKIMRRLGLAYHMIHACPNGCCLFKGALEEAEQCPVCEADRYRRSGRSRVLTLILRHFPLIPQLQRMFSSRKLSKLNIWYHFNKSVDGKMRHTADSPQWTFVQTELEPEAGDDMFARDPRHIHLGLAVDGMNPHSEKRNTQSLTPVIMFNYNLPPWMVTKKYFVMLTLLIPTQLSLNGSNFDVFLQPLVDELQQLWSRGGVLTWDARAYMGMAQFNLRAILMWTLHDFPAYGLLSGLTTKGYKGCPVCGPSTVSRQSKILRKNVY